jgi:Sec-independent protein secretion pathway component TatC
MSFFIACGTLLIFGAVRRWKWLVDPPTSLWFCYTQSAIKAIVGLEGCRAYTIFFGVLLIVFAVVFAAPVVLGI